MDAGTRGITAVASLPGRFFAGEQPQGAWITGWYQSSPIASISRRPTRFASPARTALTRTSSRCPSARRPASATKAGDVDQPRRSDRPEHGSVDDPHLSD